MASTASLRSRRSAAQLEALIGVEREIRANDHNNRRKYLRDYSEAFREYESVLTKGQLEQAIRAADVILIGDYHALPASQAYAASLIEHSAESAERPIVVGLETIFSRDQHILNEWLNREIDEQELRERIRFDLDWGYDWAPLYQLLEKAREHSAGIYGLDCMPREDLRKIGARDRHAADKIAEIRESHPDAVIMVLFGESHLAPDHLPQLVRERLAKERVLTVLQNVDALYWRAAGEKLENVEAVRVADDVVCVFNSTPLEKYENYRLCLDRWGREGEGSPDLGPTIYNLIDGLLRFLDINRYASHNSTQPKFLVDLMPEVYCRSSDGMLRRLLSRKGVDEDEKKSMLRKVDERGSAYLPRVNAFYICEFQMMYAAEETARFLHHACRGLPVRVNGHAPKLLDWKQEDLFYARALEHALAYFGSRVLCPARPALRNTDLYELYDETREDVEQQVDLTFEEMIKTLDFLVLHREYEASARRYPEAPKLIKDGVECTGKKFDYATQQLGYLLGSDLYDAYIEGRVTRRYLRHLFLVHVEEPGIAREAYFSLTRKLRNRGRYQK